MKRTLVGAVRLLDSNKLAVSPCSTFQKFISSFDVPRRTYLRKVVTEVVHKLSCNESHTSKLH